MSTLTKRSEAGIKPILMLSEVSSQRLEKCVQVGSEGLTSGTYDDLSKCSDTEGGQPQSDIFQWP